MTMETSPSSGLDPEDELRFLHAMHEKRAGPDINVRGGFTTSDGSWLDLKIGAEIKPDIIRTVITQEVMLQPESPSLHICNELEIEEWASAAYFFAAAMKLDHSDVLKSLDYDAITQGQGVKLYYKLTTPSNQQLVVDVDGAKRPIRAVMDEEVFTDLTDQVSNIASGKVVIPNSKNKTNTVQTAIKRGIFFQTLDAYLGDKIRESAQEVVRSGNESRHAGLAADINRACRTETVFYALQVVTGLTNRPGEMLKIPRDQWHESLEMLVDQLTPVVSGRHFVEVLSDEERSTVVQYISNISKVFKLTPAYTNDSTAA